jgi:hypothetical protein
MHSTSSFQHPPDHSHHYQILTENKVGLNLHCFRRVDLVAARLSPRLICVAGVLTKQGVGFVVAGGEFDVRGGGSGFEQGLDGFGGAAAGPVGVDGGFDGELKGGAALGVAGVDEGSAGDEEFYGFGPGAPCGDVEGGTVFCDVEVGIAGVEGSDGHAEVEEIADTFGVAVAGKFGEEGSGFGVPVQVGNGDGLEGSLIVPGASGEEASEWVVPGDDESVGFVEGEEESAPLEEVQDVASASVDGDVDGGFAFACAFESGVGSLVEE